MHTYSYREDAYLTKDKKSIMIILTNNKRSITQYNNIKETIIKSNKRWIKLEIKLLIKVFSASNKEGLDYSKSYNSSVTPSVGDKIKDALFAEYKIIQNVIFDYSNDQCIVELNSKEVPDDRLDGHIQEVAELHKWNEVKKES